MKELGNSDYIKELIDKGIDLGVEAGKSIIIAIIIYFVGKALISLINRMLHGVMERKIHGFNKAYWMEFSGAETESTG